MSWRLLGGLPGHRYAVALLWLMRIFGKRKVLVGWLVLFVIGKLLKRRAQRRRPGYAA
jgi:hypothetical protein